MQKSYLNTFETVFLLKKDSLTISDKTVLLLNNCSMLNPGKQEGRKGGGKRGKGA